MPIEVQDFPTNPESYDWPDFTQEDFTQDCCSQMLLDHLAKAHPFSIMIQHLNNQWFMESPPSKPSNDLL